MSTRKSINASVCLLALFVSTANAEDGTVDAVDKLAYRKLVSNLSKDVDGRPTASSNVVIAPPAIDVSMTAATPVAAQKQVHQTESITPLGVFRFGTEPTTLAYEWRGVSDKRHVGEKLLSGWRLVALDSRQATVSYQGRTWSILFNEGAQASAANSSEPPVAQASPMPELSGPRHVTVYQQSQ